MNRILLACMCAAAAAAIAAAADGREAAREEARRTELLDRIATLKDAYGRLQERCRETIERRWKRQQERVRIREDNKAEIDGMRQRQEILYNELARAREEALVRENAAQEQRENLREKTELAEFLGKQVRDKIGEAAKASRDGLPFGMEARARELNAVDGRLASGASVAECLKMLLEFRLQWLREGAGIAIRPATILPDEGNPVRAEVLAMGGGVAYGVTAQGEAYVLSAAAKNGRRGFEWKPVKRESVKTSLTAGFPLWLKEKRLTGRVPVDMLQSGVSQQLFEGRRQNLVDRFTEYARAGGPNIAVLWLVGLFAFLIALERFFVLLRRGGNDEAFTGRFIKLIKEGNATQARSMIDRSPSALARCLRLLWRERNESRPVAEKTLKEAFLKELPPLDRRLSLLAALAAAAPLLGLLGTVGGLITLFQVLNSAGTNDTKVLAGGISEALVNTLTGLAIAIPALVVHGYLSERSSFIQNSAQAACAEILNALWPASEAVVKGTAPHE